MCKISFGDLFFKYDNIVRYLFEDRLFGNARKSLPSHLVGYIKIPDRSSPISIVALVDRPFVQQLFQCHNNTFCQAEQYTPNLRKYPDFFRKFSRNKILIFDYSVANIDTVTAATLLYGNSEFNIIFLLDKPVACCRIES